MTNLVDLARSLYPPQHRCRCGVVLRHIDSAWRDGAGSDMCQPNTTHITASPLLSTYPREGDR